jgi:hypothetical protein
MGDQDVPEDCTLKQQISPSNTVLIQLLNTNGTMNKLTAHCLEGNVIFD